MQQKSHQPQPKDQEINPLDHPEDLVKQLREAYLRDNEREIPSQSSKILYQCFHPLKDMLQAVYTHQKQKSPNQNGQIEEEAAGAQHDLEDAERSLAFEYVLILEEVMPPRAHQTQHAKEKDGNAHTFQMSNEQSNFWDSVLEGSGEAKKDVRLPVSDEPHRMYPERYRLQTTQEGEGSSNQEEKSKRTINYGIQNNQSDDETDDNQMPNQIQEEFKNDGQLEVQKPNMSKKSIEAAYREESGLPTYGDVHTRRRAWQLYEQNLDQTGPNMEPNLKVIKSKSTPLYDVKEPFLLPFSDDKNDMVQFKEFKLTLWRINKFKQSRHVLAQQYLKIWGESDLQVMLDRFSFTCDLKYIYLTFYTPHNDALFKTVVLHSKTLEKVEGAEFFYYRNGNNGLDTSSSLKGKLFY